MGFGRKNFDLGLPLLDVHYTLGEVAITTIDTIYTMKILLSVFYIVIALLATLGTRRTIYIIILYN